MTDPNRRSTHPLELALGYQFLDPSLLSEALTHPSASQISPDAINNQRLEFLGDSVIGLLAGDRLFRENKEASEGLLTKARSRLVRGENLAAVAARIGIGEAIQLSEAEDSRGGRERRTTLEDAIEAVFGAIYLDGGIDACQEVFLRVFQAEDFQVDPTSIAGLNPKGELQERTQSLEGNPKPEYEILAVEGPPHDRLFTSEVRVAGRILGSGVGKTKRDAESVAAEAALKALENPDTPLV